MIIMSTITIILYTSIKVSLYIIIMPTYSHRLYKSHWINGRIRVDLKCVDIIPRVLEEAIVGIEHLMRQ